MGGHLENVFAVSLEGPELPLVDGALRAAADQMGVIRRPHKTLDLPVVAPAQHLYGCHTSASEAPCDGAHWRTVHATPQGYDFCKSVHPGRQILLLSLCTSSIALHAAQ